MDADVERRWGQLVELLTEGRELGDLDAVTRDVVAGRVWCEVFAARSDLSCMDALDLAGRVRQWLHQRAWPQSWPEAILISEHFSEAVLPVEPGCLPHPAGRMLALNLRWVVDQLAAGLPPTEVQLP